jgi:hypothetical protein
VKSVPFCKKELLHKEKALLHIVYDIPPNVHHEMLRGAEYFEEIEIWRKRQTRKDPMQ